MNFEKAKDFLKRFVSYEGMARIPYSDKTFDLQKVKDFLMEYGVAYEKLKYIHVAGSKGKGSTCAFIANYLWKGGYKVGLYTSPHLFEVTERIWFNGMKISKNDFVEYVEDLKEFMERGGRRGREIVPKLTYFEILTVLALKYFVDNGVDYAVLEVGLGGRLDATNIVKPVLSILTAVELEHMDVLGNTLSEILNEKLGIVKDGVPVLVGQQGAALKLIKQKLGDKKDVFYTQDFKVKFFEKDFSDTARFQNACTAFSALKILLKKVDEKKFLKIATGLKLPGRFDVRKVAGKRVIFDVAHTKNSIGNLVSALKNNFPNQSFVFLVAIMKGKDVKSILQIIGCAAEKIIFTNAHETRGISSKKLLETAAKIGLKCECVMIRNSGTAFRNVLKTTKKNQLLVVTGSHFLVGKLLPKHI